MSNVEKIFDILNAEYVHKLEELGVSDGQVFGIPEIRLMNVHNTCDLSLSFMYEKDGEFRTAEARVNLLLSMNLETAKSFMDSFTEYVINDGSDKILMVTGTDPVDISVVYPSRELMNIYLFSDDDTTSLRFEMFDNPIVDIDCDRNPELEQHIVRALSEYPNLDVRLADVSPSTGM